MVTTFSVPELARGEVHLWRCTRGTVPLAGGVLSPAEMARVACFARKVDGERFAARRTLLRLLLGAYAGVAPGSVEFDTTCRICGAPDHGKPRLGGAGRAASISFSSSSSGDVILVAVSQGTEVGVDVELQRRFKDLPGLARLSMSPSERTDPASVPERGGPAAFLAAWTQKEAYLKGIGAGLAASLESVPAITSAQPPEWPQASTRHLGDWTLHLLSPAVGAAACLAVEGNLPWSAVRTLPGSRLP